MSEREIVIQKEILSNGAIVLSSPSDLSQSVAFVGSMKAGSMFDEKGKYGTAEIVSRLLNRGTPTDSSNDMSRRVEEMGATLEFSNYDESVSFSGRCHSRGLQRLLEIILDCLSRPAFRQDEIDKVRSEVISDLEAESDETRTVAYRNLMYLVYGREMPYGRDPFGKIEDVLRITREDIVSFHERNYSPDSLLFSITGDVNEENLLAHLDRNFGAWEKNRWKSVRKEDYSSSSVSSIEPAATVNIPMQHKSQVDVAIGAKTVARNSSDYYPLSLGNLILGRMGLYGRLGKNVREDRGLAYYCYSALQSKRFSGHLGIFAGVNPKNVEGVLEGISEEIKKMRTEPLTDEEMRKCRKNLIGSLAISLESSAERANLIHDLEYYGLGLDYLKRYKSILKEVDSESVLAMFGKYLILDRVRLTVAGPVNAETHFSLR